VFVLNLKCDFSLKKSSECLFGWSGYFSTSDSPIISIDSAKTSTLCLFPLEVVKIPFIEIAAPVFIFFNMSSKEMF